MAEPAEPVQIVTGRTVVETLRQIASVVARSDYWPFVHSRPRPWSEERRVTAGLAAYRPAALSYRRQISSSRS